MADEGRDGRGDAGTERKADERKAKLAAQLRANLRRRKDQARGQRPNTDDQARGQRASLDDQARGRGASADEHVRGETDGG